MGENLKKVGCVHVYILYVVCNFYLILFFSEKRHNKTYGYITNWNSNGYLEMYHPECTYGVKDLPNNTVLSPRKYNG